MKKIIHRLYNPANGKLGLLVLRLTLGSVFLVHGIQKLSNMEMVIGFFGMIGIPAFLAWVVALVETVGGVAVILGAGTRIASSLLAVIMLVVIIFVKKGQGFQAMELDIVLLGLSLGIALIGTGKYSVARMWYKQGCPTCKAVDNSDCDECNCDCHK